MNVATSDSMEKRLSGYELWTLLWIVFLLLSQEAVLLMHELNRVIACECKVHVYP